MVWIENLGARVIRILERLGNQVVFLGRIFYWIIVSPLRFRAILKQIHFIFIGVRSLFVILLTAAFTGRVLRIQGFNTLRKFGSEGLLGPGGHARGRRYRRTGEPAGFSAVRQCEGPAVFERGNGRPHAGRRVIDEGFYRFYGDLDNETTRAITNDFLTEYFPVKKVVFSARFFW